MMLSLSPPAYFVFLVVLVIVCCVTASSAEDDNFIKFTETHPVGDEALEAMGFTTDASAICSLTLYNTPSGENASPQDLIKLENVLIRKFNAEHSESMMADDDSDDEQASFQIQAYEFDVLKQETIHGERKLVTKMPSFLKLRVSAKYVCYLCSADNADNRVLNDVAPPTSTSQAHGIADDVLQGIQVRAFYSAVTCLKMECGGAWVDESQGCAEYEL